MEDELRMDAQDKSAVSTSLKSSPITEFTESYASFNRVINSLQRKYIELKDEFSSQHEKLAAANNKLLELSERNLAANQFLDGLLNSAAVGVISIDQKGRITHFNPAAAAILGIPVGEPLGREYRQVIPSDEPDTASAVRTMETGAEFDSVEKTVTLADGSAINLSVSTSLMHDREGRAVGTVEVLHDLTRIKRMEHEIARLNTLAALGEMAATIAHEVRNPLSGIAGFASLLERDLKRKDPKRKLVAKIIAGVENLNNTVSTLLNYTRFDEINRVPVDYLNFLSDTIEQFKNDNPELIKRNRIEFTEVLPRNQVDSEPMIDAMLFRQIFFNIFKNAIEASGSITNVAVLCRTLSRQEAVESFADRVLFGPNETILETLIKDDGPGIPAENIDKIFSPFFTTRREGNGLGLAVAAKIVRAHGGEIMAESQEGKGSTFRLLLPIKLVSETREQN